MPATKTKAAPKKKPAAPEQVAIDGFGVSANQDDARLELNGRAYAMSHEVFLALRRAVNDHATRFVH